MREYTWDEYYEKFYDWAESTRIIHLARLTDLGPSNELSEVINELNWNGKYGDKLLKRAVEEKIEFDYDDLELLYSCCDSELVDKAFLNSGKNLTTEDIENLYGMADDDVLITVCRKYKIKIPEDLTEHNMDFDDEPKDFEKTVRKKKPGFFETLFAVSVADGLFGGKKKKHTGRCDRDCANCPPHYGYRYGRWYYGHNHIYGCEFWGNRGSGEVK